VQIRENPMDYSLLVKIVKIAKCFTTEKKNATTQHLQNRHCFQAYLQENVVYTSL